MKKALFLLLLAVLLLALSLTLVACVDEGKEDKEWGDDTLRVMVSHDHGAVVKSQNPVDVSEGESVSFELEILEGYVFKSVSHGRYNQETGVLTVDAVDKNTYIEFVTEEGSYNPEEKYMYFLMGSSEDSYDVKPGTEVSSGTLVTLHAGDMSRVFVGWSIGKSYSSGGKIVSYKRDYSFRLTEEVVTNGKVFVYANYIKAGILYYDPNGGEVDFTSDNYLRGVNAAEKGAHYTSEFEDGCIKISYDNKYLSYMECASTFHDDGTFTRDGYVLIEYNTEPDGSGYSYSLGSKFPLVGQSAGHPTLYCIWAKNSAEEDFTYESVVFNFPSGVDASKAPHWVKNGIIITSYSGDDEVVVVPEKIDGKYVTAIAKNAFADKSMTTLVLSRRLLKIEDGAFVGCSSLETVYYPDGLYMISDAWLDEDSYTSFKNLYVNATLAPRNVMGSETGAFATKLSRLLSSSGTDRIIVIGGSSVFQGLGTEYMEALLEGEYRVINLGTTRTTNGIIYLEAMGGLAHEGDVVLFAPENSAYMMGESELYWKTLRDLENMINFYRYIDVSNYSKVFDSFSDFNRNYRYTSKPCYYDQVCEVPDNPRWTNKYGDCMYPGRDRYYDEDNGYVDVYYITMNKRMKSRFDLNWSDPGQHDHKDYNNPSDLTWCSVDEPYYRDALNNAIRAAKASGAKVYFSFCPVDANALVEEADSLKWLLDYDEFLADTYEFDGVIGSSVDYIYDHTYFFDCAFHLNDYGRTHRTYQLYLDLAEELGIEDLTGYDELGTDFEGCLFEDDSDGAPLTPWQPSNP